MPRASNRIHRHLDPLVAEAERLLVEQRTALLLTDAGLNVAARVTRTDTDRAVLLWAEANRGTSVERLLDGPVGESE